MTETMFASRPEKTITEVGNPAIYKEKPMLITNYFKLKAPETIKLYKYDLTYINEKMRVMTTCDRDVSRQIFWKICNTEENRSIFPHHTKMLFNDSNLLLSLDLLNLGSNDLKRTIRTKIAKKVYHMRIVFTGFIELDTRYLDPDMRLLMQEFINMAVTQRLKAKSPQSDGRYFICYGQSIFYHPLVDRIPGFSVNFGMGLQALAGLHGEVKLNCMGGLLYNVDISHAVLYRQRVNALELAIEFLVSGRYDVSRGHMFWTNQLKRRCLNHKSGFNEKVVSRLNKFFKGLKFSPIYNQSKKELDFQTTRKKAASCEMFEYEGNNISLPEYFLRVHKIKINFPFLPCLKIGNGKLYPIELLATAVTPVRYEGQLPEKVMESLLQETAWGPEKRFRAIQEMCREGAVIPSHLASSDVYMQNFGVSLDKSFVSVQGTVLPVPTLKFGEGVTFKDNDHKGVWELAEMLPGNNNVQYKKSVEPMKAKIVVAMVIIDINTQDKDTINDKPYGVIMRTLYDLGIDVHRDCQRRPFMFERFALDNQEHKNLDGLSDCMEKFKNTATEKYPDCTPLCIFILPRKFNTKKVKQGNGNSFFNEYSTIKYICDVKVGINSQCLLKKIYDEITESLECSIARSIALKIMAKLGVKHYDIEREGEHKNWTRLTDPTQPTLLIGVDVTNLEIDDKMRGRSTPRIFVAGIVGNTDLACLRYDTSVRVQPPSKEGTVNMKEEIKRRLVAFTETNQIRPAHIVVYRDGISDGSFQRTLDEEKRSIKQACAEVDRDYNPTLTYIATTKRHHTRFALPKDQNDPTNIAGVTNVKAGTLVEGVVTSNTLFDFFLVSHNATVGTARPVHYHVLYDEWQPSFAFWQNITHALAYAYVRVPKSVSLPAPVMYAHLAAKRAKCYLEAYSTDVKLDLSSLTYIDQYQKLNEQLQRNKNLEGMIFL